MTNIPGAGSPKRISCIICAFNEAPRIATVLAVTSAHPLLHEVIVVDDGLTDATAGIVGRYPGVKLISNPINQGKSLAMATGIAAASGKLFMLLDADLTGLAGDRITALATPVQSGMADVSISLRQNSLWVFRAIGLHFISGERVIRRELLGESLAQIRVLSRFGIEVFMNRAIIERRLSVSVVHWPQVTQSRKAEKLGYWSGIRAEWRMIANLLRGAYPSLLITQTWQLLSLRARSKYHVPQ